MRCAGYPAAAAYEPDTHGQLNAAMVANVITYRARSAIRYAARVLGHSPGQQDTFGKAMDRWGGVAATAAQPGHGVPGEVLDLAARLEDAPRHLGIHSGGMVLSKTPVSEVVPIEWARIQKRSILQWDKERLAD